MKQVFVLVFFCFFSISTCASINFADFCPDIHKYIAEYLDVPYATLGSLNKNCRINLAVACSLKYLIKQRFDIPELAVFDSNEPELQYILSLSSLTQDPYHVFQGLVEDVINEKKPFNVFYASLISYLTRTFNTSTAEQKDIHSQNWTRSFESRLADFYEKKEDYKSSFEAVINNPRDIVEWYYDNDDNIKIYEMFKENPSYAEVLTAAFATFGPRQKIHWIFRCIWYNAPESFYIELLIENPVLLTRILKYCNILSNQVIKTDMPRIHAQFNKLISFFIDVDERHFYNLLADIRYGSGTIIYQIMDFSMFNENQIRMIIKASIVGQKMLIFRQIYQTHKETILRNLTAYFANSSLEQVMFLFEVINSGDDDIIIKNINNFKLIIRYYAIKNIKIINDKMVIDVIAPETLLELNLPKNFRFTFDLIGNNFDLITERLWSNFKIIDEETFYSFLCDYEALPILNRNIQTSIEVIKFILKSPVLLEKVKEIGIKLKFELFSCYLIDFLDSIVSTEGLSQIFDLTAFQNELIVFLRDKKQLKKFEGISGVNVAEIFLNEDDGLMQESDYFKWRLVLSYWIKGDQRHRITEIRSPIIIQMLRLEFYDEMLELFGREE